LHDHDGSERLQHYASHGVHRNRRLALSSLDCAQVSEQNREAAKRMVEERFEPFTLTFDIVDYVSTVRIR
jgi:hypothetical protein